MIAEVNSAPCSANSPYTIQFVHKEMLLNQKVYVSYYYFSAFNNEYVNAADEIARNAMNIAMIASIKSSPLNVS